MKKRSLSWVILSLASLSMIGVGWGIANFPEDWSGTILCFLLGAFFLFVGIENEHRAGRNAGVQKLLEENQSVRIFGYEHRVKLTTDQMGLLAELIPESEPFTIVLQAHTPKNADGCTIH